MISKQCAVHASILLVFLGVLAMAPPVLAGVIAPSNCLPPFDPNDAYTGSFHEWAAGAVIELVDPKHSGFTTCSSPPSSIGETTTDVFDSIVEGDLFINGNPIGHVQASAHTKVLVTFVSTSTIDPSCITSGPKQCFDTEIIQLDISGGNLPPGTMIRQDPDPLQRTFGSTSITNLGNGTFGITSFFDVFTELSLDGGQHWADSFTFTEVTLVSVPEPSTILLLGTVLAGMASLKRRRNKA